MIDKVKIVEDVNGIPGGLSSGTGGRTTKAQSWAMSMLASICADRPEWKEQTGRNHKTFYNARQRHEFEMMTPEYAKLYDQVLLWIEREKKLEEFNAVYKELLEIEMLLGISEEE